MTRPRPTPAVRCWLALTALALVLPAPARARLPVLIDFTEDHPVEQAKLQPADTARILKQLAPAFRASREECSGPRDQAPILAVTGAVRGDLLGDGAGPQLLLVVRTSRCGDQVGNDGLILAVVRDGKVLLSASEAVQTRGIVEVEALVREGDERRDLAVLGFPWATQGITGSGAELWGVDGQKLVRLRELGPVRYDRCESGLAGAQIGVAVFFVKSVRPLELLEKGYAAPCPDYGDKPVWKFVGDGPLSP